MGSKCFEKQWFGTVLGSQIVPGEAQGPQVAAKLPKPGFRKYNLEDVFGGGPTNNDQEIEEFYDLTTWDGYGKLLGSPLGKRMKRPSKTLMYRKGKVNDG